MLPIPAATTTLANTAETSQPVFDAFKPYAFMEIGLIVGALAIIFIIGVMAGIPEKIRAWFAHSQVRKFDSPLSHRDSEATSSAIREHRRYMGISSSRNRNRISRYD